MSKFLQRKIGLAAVLTFVLSSNSFAAVPKCIDAQASLKEQITPFIQNMVVSYFPQFDGKYEFALSRFYATNETEDFRDCMATVTMTSDEGFQSNVDLQFRVISTEDGQTITRFDNFNSKGLVAGLMLAAVNSAIKKNPSEFYAPQGPGSSAARNLEHNQGGGSEGPRKRRSNMPNPDTGNE